jgi:hypothetical protein
MKSSNVKMLFPYVFVFKKGEMQAIPTFLCSTLLTCFVLTFVPTLVPLWSQLATTLPAKVKP